MSKNFRFERTDIITIKGKQNEKKISGTIIIGDYGIKIQEDSFTGAYGDNKELRTIWLKFENIHHIESTNVLSGYDSKPLHKTFKIKGTTLDCPMTIETFCFRVSIDGDEVYKLIYDGYVNACKEKDKIIGIR